MSNKLYDFGDALLGLKKGQAMRRTGWNGKAQFIYLENENTDHKERAHIVIWTADHWRTPWLASQADILANDWEDVGVPAEAYQRIICGIE